MVLHIQVLEEELQELRKIIGLDQQVIQEVQESVQKKLYCYATLLTDKSLETMDPLPKTGKFLQQLD